MPEALARMRREPTLTAPAREPPPRRGKARAFRWTSLLPVSLDGYAGLALALAMSGIVINAALLQRERHPAPFFAGDPPAAPAPAPAPAAQADPVAIPAAPAPVRPVERAAPSAQPAPALARGGDVIGDLIRSTSGKDPTKMATSAQTALIRLGYELKADGVVGADTEAALREFEKSRGLPISVEITPRLIRQLNAAAR